MNSTDIVCYAKDEGVNLHGHVNVTKEAATELSKGMSTIGSQWGLGATIVGVSTAVGKAVAKNGIPPIQKASLILASGVVVCMGHSVISAA